MDGAPDRASGGPLRRRPARNLFQLTDLCHVFDRHFDAQIELLLGRRVDEGHGPILGDPRVTGGELVVNGPVRPCDRGARLADRAEGLRRLRSRPQRLSRHDAASGHDRHRDRAGGGRLRGQRLLAPGRESVRRHHFEPKFLSGYSDIPRITIRSNTCGRRRSSAARASRSCPTSRSSRRSSTTARSSSSASARWRSSPRA